MEHSHRIILTACLQVFTCLCLKAQDNSQISLFLDNWPEVYRNPDGYINGRRNSFVYPVAAGTPFFIQAGESGSTLETVYGSYDNLLLKYDLLNDELLLGFNNGAGIEEIMVNRQIVLGFSLYGLNFVYLQGDAAPVPGYYEEVYHSGIQCYIRHSKSLAGTSGSAGYEYRYNRRILLIKDGQSFNIKNNKTLLEALPENHEKVKSWLRKNHILVRSATSGELIRVLKFYESLQP